MKTKYFLPILAILTIIALNLVGAIEFTVSQPAKITETSTTSRFTVRNLNDTELLNITVPNYIEISGEDGYNITFQIIGDRNNINGSATFEIKNISVIDFSKFKLEKVYSTKFNVSEQGNNTNFEELTLELENLFCDGIENQGNLDVKIDDFSIDGFGDEADYWYPLDDVEIEVKVKNEGDYDIDNIEIEFCLLDKKTGDCVLDEDDIDISDDDFKLKDGKDNTVVLSFEVDPDALEAGDNDYEVLVKATGEIDDSDSPYDGNLTCSSDSEDVEIRTDEKFVVIKDIDIPETLECGEEFEVRAEVWNVGDEDLDDDEIYVRVYNKELGIEEVVDMPEIDSLEKEDLTLKLRVPEEVKEKTYALGFEVYDDEDLSDNDIYENEEDDEARFFQTFEVKGNCEKIIKDVALIPSLETAEEEVVEGNEVVIKVSVRNTGNQPTTYILMVEGNEGFSSVSSIVPPTLQLQAGEERDVLITLKLKDDSEGEHTFNIKALFDSQEKSQTVSLTVAPKKVAFDFSRLKESLGKNWFIWVVVGINIILIVAIIIVAMRISKKS